MRVFDARHHLMQPWKNGGGTTTQIATCPEDSTLENFDWRVSVASVAVDGPFSVFPDVDRTLAVIDGEGMDLIFDGGRVISLRSGGEPASFPGDAGVRSRLHGGTVRDFNVMTRRSRFHHSARLLRTPSTLAAQTGVRLLFAATGVLSFACDRAQVTLSQGSAATLRQEDGDVRVQSTGAFWLSVSIVSRVAER